MGANDKVAATSHGEYAPDVEQLRDLWVDSKLDHLPRAEAFALVPAVQAEFDSWLSWTLSEAKAEALEDFAKVIDAEERDQWIAGGIQRPGAQIVAQRMQVLGKVARNRANQYKEASDG